jgi:hypothetical protein
MTAKVAVKNNGRMTHDGNSRITENYSGKSLLFIKPNFAASHTS